MFVRLYVVNLTQDFRMTITAGNTRYRTEAGCHKRSPVFHQDNVGTFALKPFADLDPVQWVCGVYHALDAKIFGCWVGGVLCLAWEE
jgi:hypothetical protein